MGEDQEKGFDFDVPVVASRSEFFEQESMVSGPGEELAADLESDEVAEALRLMRETAAKRTSGAADAGPEEEASPS